MKVITINWLSVPRYHVDIMSELLVCVAHATDRRTNHSIVKEINDENIEKQQSKNETNTSITAQRPKNRQCWSLRRGGDDDQQSSNNHHTTV